MSSVVFIPEYLCYIVISFIPNSNAQIVCKSWNKESKKIKKKAVDLLSKWYKKMNNLDFVRKTVLYYSDDFFLVYPEFCVKKLHLNEDILSILPNIYERKRSDVRKFMLGLKLSINDCNYLGF